MLKGCGDDVENAQGLGEWVRAGGEDKGGGRWNLTAFGEDGCIGDMGLF